MESEISRLLPGSDPGRVGTGSGGVTHPSHAPEVAAFHALNDDGCREGMRDAFSRLQRPQFVLECLRITTITRESSPLGRNTVNKDLSDRI
jgi:hypothetical protein